MTFKESVFQPSSSFRFALELLNTLGENEFDHERTPHIFMVTDGGPEHRVCFESVKIPLIMIFKKLQLQSLVAIRTAPGHSYVNIVERIMSILNIGFQNVSLERKETNSDADIKKCKNLVDLRSNPGIKKDWQDSLAPLVKTLEDRTSRLSLKDKPFKVSFLNVLETF